MGGGVTTGSLLNQRVFKRNGGSGSSNKGDGVKRSALMQTKITLADRNKGTGRASYTSLSNSINGRKEVIYVGGGSQYSGTSSMSTMDKIAMWNSFIQQGLQSGQAIASLFSAGKAENTGSTGNAKGTSGSGNTGGTGDVGGNTPPTQPKVNQDLKTTAAMISGDSIISGMENAQTSVDLQAAINDAQSYFDGQLTNSLSEAKGNAQSAKELLDNYKENDTLKNCKKDVENAKQDVANAEQGIKAFESKVGKEERNIQEANDALCQADTNYKKALDDTAFGEKSLAQAKKDVQTANQGVQTAESQVSTAQGKVDGLKLQLATATPEQKASIQSQLSQAETELSTAQQKLLEAKMQQTRANDMERSAETQLKNYQQAEEKALKNVDDNKKGVADAKKKLAESKQDLEKAQGNLEAKQKELETKQKELQDKEALLKQTEDQIAQAEADIEKFEQVEKEYNSLKSEITDQKERLTKMVKKEQSSMDKLDKKIARQEAKSDKAEEKMNLEGQAQGGHDVTGSEKRAGKRMARAEQKEAALRAKKAAIAGSHISTTFDSGNDGKNVSENNGDSPTMAEDLTQKKKTQADYMFHSNTSFG